MILRILFIFVLLVNSVFSEGLLAKETPEQISTEKISKEEKKKQIALEKQKKKEEKENQKLEKIRIEKEKKVQEDKLLVVTPEDLDRFRRIVKKLTTQLGRDPQDYRLTVKESTQLNAYASLDKRLTVNSATFHKLKTEAGLATIIAHEMGHIESKHVSKRIAAGVTANAAAITLGILSGSAGTARLLNNVTDTATSAHSRSQERAADLFAVDLMNKTYCNEPGKLEAYKIFIEGEKDINYFFQYYRSHPMSKDRYDYMAKIIKDAGCVL
jgi:predicted Zn-dependent protease